MAVAMPPLKVILWGLGGVGSLALRELLDNPMFEVIAVKAFSAGKAGKDAGELIGGAATGLLVTVDEGALPFEDADCVLYCPRMADYEAVTECSVGVSTSSPPRATAIPSITDETYSGGSTKRPRSATPPSTARASIPASSAT